LLEFDDTASMMKFDDLCTQFECGSFGTYASILEIVRENGGKRVFDIGCAFGYQSEVARMMGMSYVGIEGFFDFDKFWNEDEFEYIRKVYPFKIHTSATDVAISKLCIGWNCFKFEDDTYRKQLEALARDFKTVVLYTTKEFTELAKHFFNVEEVDENLYLLKRRD